MSTSPFRSKTLSGAGPVLYATVCEVTYVPALVCVEGFNSLVSSIFSGSYTLSAFSSPEFLEPGEGSDGDILFSAECSKVS